jgi:hypothetical protein
MNVSGISRKAQCGGTGTRDEQDLPFHQLGRARSAAAEVLFSASLKGRHTDASSIFGLVSAAEITFREICSSGEMKAFQLQALQSANSSR